MKQPCLLTISSSLLVVLVLLTSHLQPASALYHTSSEILHWFSSWAAKRPDVLRFRELHERQTSTVLPVATLSSGINSPDHKPRPAVLFVFGEHARELITPEVGIWLARMLVDTNSSVYHWPELSAAFERAGIDALGRTSNSSSTSIVPSTAAATAAATGTVSSVPGKVDWPAVVRGWVQELLASFEVVIVPIEALDSRRLVEAGQLCVRKTASNVDLNRNWPYAWKKESATEEQYGGPNPFSEPQSRLMKHLIDHLTGRLLGYVNVHSGEWALYTPWDSKEAYGPGLPADLPDLVNTVGRLCDCKAGPAGAVSGYLAFGTSMDYLYVHKRVPYPLTVEVYGGDNIGKLTGGQQNKELTAWPIVTKSGAPTKADAQFQRRLQQQSQGEGLGDGLSVRVGRKLLGWWVRELLLQAAPGTGSQGSDSPQQHQQHQQQGARKGLHRRRRRRKHSQQPGLLPDADVTAAAAAAAVADGGASAASTAAGAAAGVPSSGFSAGGNLEQLKQQAKQQLLQDQQQSSSSAGTPGVLSIPNDPNAAQSAARAGAGGGDDAILGMVAAAQTHQQSCFDAFNPKTEAEYRRVIADWLAASVIMMKHMLDGAEGQNMIAQVAAGAASGSFVGSEGHHSGISIHEPSSSPAAAAATAGGDASTAGGR